jgi:hypothetical protein
MVRRKKIGECTKFKEELVEEIASSVEGHKKDYYKLYYQAMGDAIDQLYASTTIGFECRGFIMYELRDIFAKDLGGEFSDSELMRYRLATTQLHQTNKILADLNTGKFEKLSGLTYKDFDDYAAKIAAASKSKAINIEDKPKTVHSIWLTHPENPRELLQQDIKSLIARKKFFADDGEWSHVVWTNNKKLIPKSVKTLEKNGIEVRSIYEIKDELKLFDKVIELIEQNKFGMTSDILRYSIIDSEGGTYADLNYKFFQKIWQYVQKYDWFSDFHQNNFFAAKKHHIVLEKTLEEIAGGFKKPAGYIDSFSKDHTLEMTYLPYVISLIRNSNKDGNIDFYYDYYDAHGLPDLGAIGQDNVGSESTWREL